MTPLQSKRNTREVERRVLSAARSVLGTEHLRVGFHDGRWYVASTSGTWAAYVAVDAERGGFNFVPIQFIEQKPPLSLPPLFNIHEVRDAILFAILCALIVLIFTLGG